MRVDGRDFEGLRPPDHDHTANEGSERIDLVSILEHIFPELGKAHLREQVYHAPQNQGGYDLDCEWHAPLPAVSSTRPRHIASICGPRRDNHANCTEQLLKSSDLAANLSVGNLGLENWDDPVTL